MLLALLLHIFLTTLGFMHISKRQQAHEAAIVALAQALKLLAEKPPRNLELEDRWTQ